jgi:hypothetical protein
MKKFIALSVCVFVAFAFEGCSPYYGSYQQPVYEPEPVYAPPPEPKPKPKPKPKPVAKPVAQPVVKKKVDYEITTDNLYPIPKALDVNNDLTIVSLTPVAYSAQDHCNEVYFFSAIVTPNSGYHGLVDISMSESKIEGGYACKYFGSAVTYQVKPNPFIKETIKYEDVVRKFTAD